MIFKAVGFSCSVPIISRIMKKLKAVLAASLVSLSCFQLFSFDLTEAAAGMAGAFEGLVDDNEGLTSFRSLNIPSGGRIESLGGAGTALGDDISFFDYNPAASAILESSEAAMFHNAWIGDSAMETIAATGRRGQLGYGGQLRCFYVPFSEYNFFGDKVASSYYSETSATANISYNFKAGYRFKGIAVGGNLRGAWRNVPDYTDNQTDKIIDGSGLAQSGLGIMVDAGVIVRLNVFKRFASREPNLRLGAALNNVGVSLTGFGKSVKLDDPLPTRLSLGAAYRIIKPILVTLDIKKPLNILDIPSSEKFSVSLGGEFTVADFCKIDAGFCLQGGSPRISLGSTFSLKRIELGINYTFDLTSSANPVNHISCSVKALLPGKAKIRQNLQKKIDDNYIKGLKLYAQGEYEEAIACWDLVIEAAMHKQMAVTFEPAIEAKASAERFLASKQRITDMNKLNATPRQK